MAIAKKMTKPGITRQQAIKNVAKSNGIKTPDIKLNTPYFTFTPLQDQTKVKLLKLADYVIKYQLKSGQFADKLKTKADFDQQIQLCHGLLMFTERRGYINYRFGLDYFYNDYLKAAFKGCIFLLKSAVKKKAYAYYNSKNSVVDTAKLLNLVALVVRAQVAEKWRPLSSFRMENEPDFFKWGENLALYLIKKQVKNSWSDNISDNFVILHAVLQWIQCCSIIWAHSPQYKTNQNMVYAKRETYYKILGNYLKKYGKNKQIVPLLTLMVKYPGQVQDILDKIKTKRDYFRMRKLPLAQKLEIWTGYGTNWGLFHVKEVREMAKPIDKKIAKAVKLKINKIANVTKYLPIFSLHTQFPASNFLDKRFDSMIKD